MPPSLSITVRAACLALAFLNGCSTKLFPTPLVYREGGADPWARVATDHRSTSMGIFYAADRVPRSAPDPAAAYSDERGGTLRLGCATVRLGAPGLSWDELVARTRRRNPPAVSIARVEEFGKLWTAVHQADPDYAAARDSRSPEDPIRAGARRWAGEINGRLARTGTRSIVLHVPGFNTSFATPVYRMAWLEHNLGGDAVGVAYCWPAWNTALGYSKQLATGRASVRNLRQLILFLAEHTDAEHIHIIALSNGAQLVTDALVQIRLSRPDLDPGELRRRLRIGHVIYAAADEDIDHLLSAYLDGFDQVAAGIVLYTSRNDLGLALSRIFVSGYPRVGQAGKIIGAPGLDQAPSTVVIDVTPAQGRANDDIYAHSYWYMNPWVSSDVLLLLRHNLAPDQRGLVPIAGGKAWSFPGDYPDRATAIAREALSRP